MYCTHCHTAVENASYIRSGLGMNIFCSLCYLKYRDTIEPCYYCSQVGQPLWYFHLPFVHLGSAITVKVCSQMCRDKEVAYAHNFNDTHGGFGLMYQCQRCQHRAFTMKRCSRCKYIRYCSEECQVADWKQHRKECDSMSK